MQWTCASAIAQFRYESSGFFRLYIVDAADPQQRIFVAAYGTRQMPGIMASMRDNFQRFL